MKDYFDQERQVDCCTNLKKGEGKVERDWQVPAHITRGSSLSYDADLPVSGNVERELLQAQAGRFGTIRKSHRLIFTIR